MATWLLQTWQYWLHSLMDLEGLSLFHGFSTQLLHSFTATHSGGYYSNPQQQQKKIGRLLFFRSRRESAGRHAHMRAFNMAVALDNVCECVTMCEDSREAFHRWAFHSHMSELHGWAILFLAVFCFPTPKSAVRVSVDHLLEFLRWRYGFCWPVIPCGVPMCRRHFRLLRGGF